MEIGAPGGTGGGGGGGKTLTLETPVGTVNGVNTTFTVANTPVFIEVDGSLYVPGYGYTYSAPTITTDPTRPPVQNITSFYNA